MRLSALGRLHPSFKGDPPCVNRISCSAFFSLIQMQIFALCSVFSRLCKHSSRSVASHYAAGADLLLLDDGSPAKNQKKESSFARNVSTISLSEFDTLHYNSTPFDDVTHAGELSFRRLLSILCLTSDTQNHVVDCLDSRCGQNAFSLPRFVNRQ